MLGRARGGRRGRRGRGRRLGRRGRGGRRRPRHELAGQRRQRRQRRVRVRDAPHYLAGRDQPAEALLKRDKLNRFHIIVLIIEPVENKLASLLVRSNLH